METPRILVTGEAGFIGSHLARALVMAWYGVTILDILSTGSLVNFKDVIGFI
jgi:nucleoside-diphosphate-sugar epimerase